jgi:hypothetical protein
VQPARIPMPSNYGCHSQAWQIPPNLRVSPVSLKP